MTEKDMDQLRAVLTHVVETGDIWSLMPPHLQDAAMDQFLRLENEALEAADKVPYHQHPAMNYRP